jgi:hypothetical protein
MKKNAVIFMGKRSVTIAILLVITSTIFISVASAATTTYDYSSGATTDKWAWEVIWDKVPPNIPTVETITPLTTEQYGWISTPNDVRWLMSDPGPSNYISMKSTIDIQESAASITNILFHGEAYKDGSQPREVRVYGYNQITSAWVYFGSGTVPASPPDGTVEVRLTADFDQYIEADGKMTWCFFLNRQDKTLYLDYIKVEVTYTPIITSCNSAGNEVNQFAPKETVRVKGDALDAGTSYKIWIQNDPVSEGESIVEAEDPSTTKGNLITTNAQGDFSATPIWAIPEGAAVTNTPYDIVADNQVRGTVGTYNAADDCLDSATVAGIVAPVPDVSSLILFASGLVLISVYFVYGRKKKEDKRGRWDCLCLRDT